MICDVPSLKSTRTVSWLVCCRLPMSAAGLPSGISVDRDELSVSPVAPGIVTFTVALHAAAHVCTSSSPATEYAPTFTLTLGGLLTPASTWRESPSAGRTLTLTASDASMPSGSDAPSEKFAMTYT